MALLPGFDLLVGRLRGRPRQTLVLTRHFFNRLFQNDIFPFEDQMKEKVYILLAMLATVGWFLTTILFSQYMFVEDTGQSWLEKLAFLSFFMLFMGLAVALEWDVLFPDRRDHLNLTPLPVKPGTIVTAKFASFILFVAMYTVAVSSLSMFGISFFLPRWAGDSLGSMAAYFVGHFASGAAAYAFVFLLFLFLEAVLAAVLGPRLLRAVSLVLRFVLALAVVVALVLALTDVRSVKSFLDLAARTRETNPTSLLLCPPAWFVSMYEIIIGRSEPLYRAGANIGLAAILILAVACRIAMKAGYRRQANKEGEVRSRAKHWPDARRAAIGAVDRLLFRNQAEKGVFRFVLATLRRSPLHKVRLAGSLAFALACVFLIIGLPRTNWTSPRTAGVNLLGAPLVMGFFLLLGFRSAFNIPFSAEANWTFRTTERQDHRPYFAAVKKILAIFLLLPLGIIAVAVHAGIWGLGPALLHGFYILVWTALLAELLFWKYARIPFVCNVVPGKARLYSRWLPYLLAFALAFGLLTSFEASLFKAKGRFVVFLAVMAAIIAGLEVVQRRFVYPKLAIVYEEEPEPVMVTL
jgi:hypothetical protein